MVPGHQQGGRARGSYTYTLRDTRHCVKAKEKTSLKDKSEQEENTSLSGAGRSKHLFEVLSSSRCKDKRRFIVGHFYHKGLHQLQSSTSHYHILNKKVCLINSEVPTHCHPV